MQPTTAGHTDPVRSVAVLLALVTVSSARAATTAPPTLQIARLTPLVVAGSHFRSHERVRVSAAVSPEVRATRVATASAAGSFRVGFGDLATDRCTGVRVVAVGASGSRAALKAAPQCPPP